MESKCPSKKHITQNFSNAGYSSGFPPSALYSWFGNLPSAAKILHVPQFPHCNASLLLAYFQTSAETNALCDENKSRIVTKSQFE